jgi:hypothetical protein
MRMTEEFDLGFFGVGGVVYRFVEILDLLVGEADFDHCVSKLW